MKSAQDRPPRPVHPGVEMFSIELERAVKRVGRLIVSLLTKHDAEVAPAARMDRVDGDGAAKRLYGALEIVFDEAPLSLVDVLVRDDVVARGGHRLGDNSEGFGVMIVVRALGEL